MNLQWSEEQQLLRDMVRRFVAGEYGFEQRQKFIASEHGFSRGIWAALAELGLMLLSFSEADGGMAGGGLEASIVAEAFGQGLVAEPYLASAVKASTALAAAPAGGMREQWIADLQSGEKIAAFVDAPELDFADGLTGEAICVAAADIADFLIVAASKAGAPVLLALGAGAVQRDGYKLHGGGTAADIRFEHNPALVLAEGAAAAEILLEVRAAGEAFLIAEALGAAQAGFELTVEYLKTRVQFGKPLGANQALQHRASEMFVELEQLRSAALYAAVMRDTDERELAVAAAKYVALKAMRFIGQQIVQLHGGIGVTQEYAAGHYFMRLTAIAAQLGTPEAASAAIAAKGGFTSPAPYWESAA